MDNSEYFKDCICKEYAINYKELNLKLLKENKIIYRIKATIVILIEFKKGYKLYLINRPTKNGTLIKYKRIGKEEFTKKIANNKTKNQEADNILKFIEDKINEWNL